MYRKLHLHGLLFVHAVFQVYMLKIYSNCFENDLFCHQHLSWVGRNYGLLCIQESSLSKSLKDRLIVYKIEKENEAQTHTRDDILIF